MKSRDDIVIIMLQWMRLYTLGSRGSRELKTFLEIHLISSRIDQKLKNNEELHRFLKRKLAPRWWPFDPVVGTDSWRHGGDFFWRRRGSKLSGESALIFASKEPRSCHDRATIVCRSWS